MNTLILTFFMFSGISGKIQGSVVDADTKEPLPYVNVIIQETEMGTATDEDGYFYILNVAPGTYTIEVSCVGYQTKRIENVVVEFNRTARLEVELTQTPIEISPVTVTSKMPAVKKDYVGATYIVRKTELPHLPLDYTAELVSFQAGVAHSDTAIHVRGGRATEVQYMIDNVPIVDPQTGDLAINISKGIVDEIIFLPGGFDAEYGRAMSGVINLISVHPEDRLKLSAYAKTEKIMPFYYDFGYQNYRSSIHLPFSKSFKGLISADVMHTDDWDPKLYILPHKWRDDYALYSKWSLSPSGKLKLVLSGALSRMQFDRYNTLWQFHLDHYRSDMRKGNLQIFNLNYLPTTRSLFTLTTSRLYTERIYGVRNSDDKGPFNDFSFKAYEELEWPRGSVDNPFGAVYRRIICEGDYPEYQRKSTQIIKTNLNGDLQMHKYHEVKFGSEYTYQELTNFTYFISDSQSPIVDDYQHHPKEYAVYLQDNIDYKGVYAKIGCRYDYFSWDIEGIEPKTAISPRFGFSFLVTEKFLFRANIGRYVQPPLYDYIYSYYTLLPLPSYIKDIPPVGNPDIGPEKTISYEIGLQGEIKENLNLTINSFFKDVSDLIGTRYINVGAQNYVSYFNVEYANIKGLEAILAFSNSLFNGKISYTLSWARGTSSYAKEVWERRYIDPEFTPATEEYDLDFDQRHRIFIQGVVKLPLQTNLYLFGYLGDGFPYTPPGPEGKFEERNILRLPFQKQFDCVISKSVKFNKFSLTINLEVINLFDQRYEVTPHFPVIPVESIKKEDFEHDPPYIDIHSSYYNPGADGNHDGLIEPSEEFINFRELISWTDDWVNAYTAPRRARLGISINF